MMEHKIVQSEASNKGIINNQSGPQKGAQRLLGLETQVACAYENCMLAAGKLHQGDLAVTPFLKVWTPLQIHCQYLILSVDRQPNVMQTLYQPELLWKAQHEQLVMQWQSDACMQACGACKMAKVD